jgi:putative lipoprotein
MTRLSGSVILALGAVLCGCSYIPHDPSFASLSGTVSYRQRIALVPEAVVLVELVDLSSGEVREDIIAAQRIERPGQVPVKFELKYDENAIVRGHHYAVVASIYQGRRLIFNSPTSVPVLDTGSPHSVEVILDPVSS